MASDRLRAIWKLQMPDVREFAGLHEFDGQVQDLSPSGVAALLAPIGRGAPEPDAHDEAQLSAVETGARTEFEVAEFHRWNPLVHLANLDLACYDREYAPAEERAAAKAAHLAAWPDAIDGAIESLDSTPAPVATSLAAGDPGPGRRHRRCRRRPGDARPGQGCPRSADRSPRACGGDTGGPMRASALPSSPGFSAIPRR